MRYRARVKETVDLAETLLLKRPGQRVVAFDARRHDPSLQPDGNTASNSCQQAIDRAELRKRVCRIPENGRPQAVAMGGMHAARSLRKRRREVGRVGASY